MPALPGGHYERHTVDETKLNEFLGKAVGDLGAAISATLILVGDRLGLYRELAKGAMTSAELAQRTGTNERYIREWLGNQGAGGYVQYDAASDEWSLSPEQALCLTDPNGPVDMNCRAEPKLPIVGCGHGASTHRWHGARPTRIRSRRLWTMHDAIHPGSSTEKANDVGGRCGYNARFEVADAVGYKGEDFDLIAFFDCLHDMGDPVSVSRHAREAISDDATAMIVEPFANDRVQDNLNPVGRVMYGASTQICVPVSLARNGPALGAQAGEARLREVVVDGGGFTRFRRATETPFNLVLEARP